MEHIAPYFERLLPHFPRIGGGIALWLLLCLTGLCFLAAAAQSRGLSRGRPAYGKCAAQLGGFAVRLAGLAVATGAAVLALRREEVMGINFPAPSMEILRAHFPLALLPLAAIWALLSAIFMGLYAGLREKLRNLPRLHQLPALFGGLSAYAALYLCLLYVYEQCAHFAAQAYTVSGAFDPHALFFPDADAFWGAVSWLPFLAVALAGGFGALWLLLRRRTDDYGRDHYNLALAWCAGWARNAWILLWLLLLARFVLKVLAHSAESGWSFSLPVYRTDLLLLGIFLAPGLLWFGISRSPNPLRAKIALVLAPLIASAFIWVIQMGLC